MIIKKHFSYRSYNNPGLNIRTGLFFVLCATGYWLPGYKLEKSWAMGIHVCVMYNALETALVLLQAGAAVNQMPNGKTPLHVACEVSNSDCVALLLAHGAKVNSLSLSGHAPLHYCITAKSVDCAKQLIVKGLDAWMCGSANADHWFNNKKKTKQPLFSS